MLQTFMLYRIGVIGFVDVSLIKFGNRFNAVLIILLEVVMRLVLFWL